MRKLSVILVLGIILEGACISSSIVPATSTSLPSQTYAAALSETVSPVLSEPAETSTSAPLEPTLLPPPAIVPELFTQAKVEHEYWPAIRQAAGLWEEARFGLSQTAWAISPNGQYIAVAGCNGEGGQSGELFSYVPTICQEPNGLGMITQAYAFILDTKTESIIATLPETGQELTISQLAFTRDSNTLIYGWSSTKYDPNEPDYYSGSSGIKFWDISSGRVQSEITEAGSGFLLSPDDKLVLFFEDETKIWDIASEKFIGKLPDMSTFEFPASLSPDGKRLLTEDYPYLVVYDTGTWQKISQQIVMPDGRENTWEVSPDFSLVAICDKRLGDTPTKIWSVATGELVKTLNGVWGKCGRLIFSPDSRLLLRFNEHGAGPVIWKVDGWKLAQANPNLANFVEDKDYFVDQLQFTQDGGSILVGTFNRLTLYSLPPGTAGTPVASAAVAPTATTDPTAILLPEIPVMSCDIVSTGWVKVHLQPCLYEFSSEQAGEFQGSSLLIDLRERKDENSVPSGVTFDVPLIYIKKRQLPVGEYIIGVPGSELRVSATFDYYYPDGISYDHYSSYDGGTFIISQTGQSLSGSFSFGAHTYEGRQVVVEGSFENIPFNPVNIP